MAKRYSGNEFAWVTSVTRCSSSARTAHRGQPLGRGVHRTLTIVCGLIKAGFRRVVGLMGSSPSAVQESALLQHFERIVLMLDGDAAGQAASAAIAAGHSGWHSVQVIRVPDGSQPDRLSSSTIRQAAGSSWLPDGRCHDKTKPQSCMRPRWPVLR